jgi:hypothetical protein
MMAAPLTDLLEDLTPKGLLEDLLAVGKALGLSTTAFQPGEPIAAFADIFCGWLAPIWNAGALPALRALFLEYSSGDWLTLTAWVMYRVHRKRETFATGPALTVENREGGFWTINPGDIRFANADGKTFTNIDGGTLASFTGVDGVDPYPTLDLVFEADEAGTASDTPPGGVPAYPNALEASPGDGVYLRTNTVALLGQDLEEDEDLKSRCRKSTGPLSPAGPPNAYEFVALSTRRPDGTELERLLADKAGDTAVNVNRVRVINMGGGVANVRLASPSGAASGDVGTAGSDVYLVNQAIQTLVVPIGFTANVAAADEEAPAIHLGLQVLRSSKVTAAAAEAAALAAVNKLFRTYPIGGRAEPSTSTRYIIAEEVRSAAKAAIPGIYNVTEPASDIPISSTAVAAPTVTATATIVTQ